MEWLLSWFGIGRKHPYWIVVLFAAIRTLAASAGHVINTTLGASHVVPRGASVSAMLQGQDAWNLDFPLFQWSPYDVWTLRHACEAVCIFGEVGAAKSTGSAAFILLKFLEIGMGGLVCCVKSGECSSIEAYASMKRRRKHLIVVSPKNHWRCNLIRCVLKRPGIVGSRIEAVVSLLMTIVEAAERGERGNAQEAPFWRRSLRQILRDAIQICMAARGEVTMRMLHEVISSAPLFTAQVHDEAWQEQSVLYQFVLEAEGKEDERSEREQRDYELAARYFLSEFPAMPADTRGSILATYSVMADVLLRGHMADLFDGDTNFVPELTFEGAIVVLDLPLKIYGQAGLYVQAAFAYIWQTACEQRDVNRSPRPLFWYVDEAHDLVDTHTSTFLATARSARVASILISQNKPNYLAAMGGEFGRHHVDAFLGNMGTKIFHANGDPETNNWASSIISDEIQARANWHGTMEHGHGRGGGSESIGRKVLASAFTTLKKGGPQNNFMTECIVYQTGASFGGNNGEPWLRTEFKQQIPGVTTQG